MGCSSRVHFPRLMAQVAIPVISARYGLGTVTYYPVGRSRFPLLTQVPLDFRKHRRKVLLVIKCGWPIADVFSSWLSIRGDDTPQMNGFRVNRLRSIEPFPHPRVKRVFPTKLVRLEV